MESHIIKTSRSDGARSLARYLHDEVAAGRLRPGVRLPPERELSELFSVSRGTVRRVLSDFRERGIITQAVGSGTFVAASAQAVASAHGEAMLRLDTSPAELMEARLMIEPLMPSLIVRNATASDLAAMQHCLEASEAADSIETFEVWDGRLHRSLAVATHNSFFVHIADAINQVRDQGEWGRLKLHSMNEQRRTEYEQDHRGIVEALQARDVREGRAQLVRHLERIRHHLFGAEGPTPD